MRYLILAALLSIGVAHAQSPTYQNLTVTGTSTLQGTLNLTASGTALSVANNAVFGTAAPNGLQLAGTTLSVTGAGNAAITFQAVGSGQFFFKTSGGNQVSIADAPNATSRILLKGGAGNATVQAIGDANAALLLMAGTGGTAGTMTAYVPAYFRSTVANVTPQVLTAGQNISPNTTSPPAFYHDIGWSGAITIGGPTPYYFRARDTVDASGADFIPTWWLFDHEYNAGAGGGRTPYVFIFNKNAPSLEGDRTFVNVTIKGNANTDEGGTANKYMGYYGMLNVDGSCKGDYYRVCTNMESDFGVYAGMHVAHAIGFSFGNHQFDAAHGTVDDAAIAFLSSPSIVAGTGGRTVLMQLGTPSSQWPLDPTLDTSAIMQIHPYTYNHPILHNLGQPQSPVQYFAGYGIDLAYANFSHYAWRSPGFAVDGAGQLSIGSGTITYGASGIVIQSPKVTTISAVPNNGGTPYRIGDEVMDAIGGLWTVTAVAGTTGRGAVTALAPLRAGYAPTCPAANAPTTGGSGAGLTLNITCAPTNTTTIGAAGQTLNLAAGTIIANLPTTPPAVHCALWVNAGVINQTICP